MMFVYVCVIILCSPLFLRRYCYSYCRDGKIELQKDSIDESQIIYWANDGARTERTASRSSSYVILMTPCGSFLLAELFSHLSQTPDKKPTICFNSDAIYLDLVSEPRSQRAQFHTLTPT